MTAPPQGAGDALRDLDPRCGKPGCGARRVGGQPCTDWDCPQQWVGAAEHRSAISTARATAEAEVGRLRDQVAVLTADRDRMKTALEAQEEALVRIVQWSEAYPTDVFTPPDYPAIRKTLTANGFVPGHTLDGIAADCLRKATEGVGKIARAALSSSSHPESADADRT